MLGVSNSPHAGSVRSQENAQKSFAKKQRIFGLVAPGPPFPGATDTSRVTADDGGLVFLSDKPPGSGIGSISLPQKGKGVYRFAARQHLLGVESPSVGADAGGS